jgi:hypothetical protein
MWARSGSEDRNTFIWEQEWESLAALDASYSTYRADEPEAQELETQSNEVFSSVRYEIYSLLPGG